MAVRENLLLGNRREKAEMGIDENCVSGFFFYPEIHVIFGGGLGDFPRDMEEQLRGKAVEILTVMGEALRNAGADSAAFVAAADLLR